MPDLFCGRIAAGGKYKLTYDRYSYPVGMTDSAKETPVGATCHAQECIGVDHTGDFRILINEYDSNGNKQSETFLIKVGKH